MDVTFLLIVILNIFSAIVCIIFAKKYYLI